MTARGRFEPAQRRPRKSRVQNNATDSFTSVFLPPVSMPWQRETSCKRHADSSALFLTPYLRCLRALLFNSFGFLFPVGSRSSVDEAAVRAAKAWRFAPAQVGGASVSSEIEVPIRF